MSVLAIVLVIVLILILVGGVGGPYLSSGLPYGYGGGHYGIGIVGIILIVIIVLALMGRV